MNAIEDLAVTVYGEEGAAKFFQFAPKTWPELAKGLDNTETLLRWWQFEPYAKHQRTLSDFLDRALNVEPSEGVKLQDKIEGVAEYLDALERFLLRSLEQWDITLETIH